MDGDALGREQPVGVDPHHGPPIRAACSRRSASSGASRTSAGPASTGPHASTNGETASIIVDKIRLEGGQDNPTTAVDTKTGKTLWTHPGSPVYGDVWAVATYPQAKPIKARAHLLVTVPLYMKWDQPEVSR